MGKATREHWLRVLLWLLLLLFWSERMHAPPSTCHPLPPPFIPDHYWPKKGEKKAKSLLFPPLFQSGRSCSSSSSSSPLLLKRTGVLSSFECTLYTCLLCLFLSPPPCYPSRRSDGQHGWIDRWMDEWPECNAGSTEMGKVWVWLPCLVRRGGRGFACAFFACHRNRKRQGGRERAFSTMKRKGGRKEPSFLLLLLLRRCRTNVIVSLPFLNFRDECCAFQSHEGRENKK